MNTSQGVKILGKDLEKTLAGLPLLVALKEDEIPVLKVTLFFSFKCFFMIHLGTHCTVFLFKFIFTYFILLLVLFLIFLKIYIIHYIFAIVAVQTAH